LTAVVIKSFLGIYLKNILVKKAKNIERNIAGFPVARAVKEYTAISFQVAKPEFALDV
jgi:hypothetical protein